MTRLYIDFETYCDLNLKKVGLYKYTAHKSFHPWCAAYAFDDNPIHIWLPTWKRIEGVLCEAIEDPEVKIYAHLAEFEMATINNTPALPNVKSNKFVDTMALAGTFGYPLGLDKFVKAVGLPYGKTAGTTRLKNKLCTPQKRTAFNTSGKWTPKTAPKEFEELYEYCINDLDIMRKAVKRLPQEELSPLEQYVWQHTAMRNQRGVMIDAITVDSIIKVLDQYKIQQELDLKRVTHGSATSGNQTAKIKEWIGSRMLEGRNILNLKKETVARWLDRQDIPLDVKRVLELRRDLARSSTAKFDRMWAMGWDDHRVRGNEVYYGAHTGRFAGRGIQIHNLPRASHKHPDLAMRRFNTQDIKFIKKKYPNVQDAASKLVRHMIRASDKKKLVVADYSSIENVVLHWYANDTVTLEEFRQGLNQYRTYASARFDVKYENVTKDQYQYAKPCILGLGFGGGANALVFVASGYGIDLTHEEAQRDVAFYRKKYKKVPKLWNEVFNKAYMAVATKEPQILLTGTTRLEFRCAGGYLFILLPSGRRLSYPQVRLNAVWTIKGDKTMSSKISYMGIKEGAWLRLGTHPGKLVENIVQASARDILTWGMLCAEQAGYSCIGSVHDEVICETPDTNEYKVAELCEYICMRQPWAKDIPIRAAGYEAQRYRKD